VLIKGNEDVVHLPFVEGVDLASFKNSKVIVTGSYDICSETLTISDPKAIELLISISIPSP